MDPANTQFCPMCGKELKIRRMACPGCGAEYPVNRELSAYDRLSEQNALFLQTFLKSRGNMKELQQRLDISYPTARKRLEELLVALGLETESETETEAVMEMYSSIKQDSTRASDLIRRKLYENGGKAVVRSMRGKTYIIKAAPDGASFYCKELPIEPPYRFRVFDVMVDLMAANGGRAPKGNGRNYRLGSGDCTEDTLVGAIAKNYAGKKEGESVYDPVFVLAAVLEWAGIARNERGYLELTPEYRRLLR